ncbi:kinase-like protein [Gloeophyllum trabeum ATCC 11539]|uniref:Kinase-like protein n=1 Tax=Gloeophyllum trabeum (strain ATCC 11539 / FP-39264 / Madison 617) TaxID=670483 RepID=S7RMT7_GLOTA|nr:kinase-like protein [Gloeophyllum trabeum ATCC 11539]EPQ55780.1 kinase-like protein [Gloeophyllum trabeum ATCC 11539]
MHSDAFDVIPFEDIKGDWKKLGSGSFGNVYKGNYLGIDVAIKEVLPSNDYDVAKYFEREWRLMKEARHPNVVLYLGLSRAPDPDGRIFIISEFIDGGSVRQYIHDKSKPFPWRLRLSFATDIARALAYLHARRCIHRDLKGENLLVTSNGRIKITDFGFARIAARNADESKRLTFCGTDSYMSPEILVGNEFDLPTDIYSLGIIFCEIAARKLADDKHFRRVAPFFAIDADEVRSSVSPGCPDAFIALTLDCLANDPAQRPTTRTILERLAQIEADILAQPSEGDDAPIGTVKFMTGVKRPSAAPRIPSFGMGVGKDIRNGNGNAHDSSDDETSEDELMEAVMGLRNVDLNSHFSHADRDSTTRGDSAQPLIDDSSSLYSEYSTTVIRSHPHTPSEPPSLSSILTIRPSPDPNGSPSPIPGGAQSAFTTPGESSLLSIESYRTARSSIASASIAAATEGGSTIRSLRPPASALVHRFTLIKPGAKRGSGSGGMSPTRAREAVNHEPTWSPLNVFFSSGLLVSKCDLCNKRLGWKPVLECDDCGLRAHTKCGEMAPMDCGLRPTRPVVHHRSPSPSPGGKKTKAS